MALPSQAERSSELGRSYAYRQHQSARAYRSGAQTMRRAKPVALFLLLAVLLATGAWWAVGTLRARVPAPAPEVSLNEPSPAAQTPPPPPEPAPVLIHQGSSRPEPTPPRLALNQPQPNNPTAPATPVTSTTSTSTSPASPTGKPPPVDLSGPSRAAAPSAQPPGAGQEPSRPLPPSASTALVSSIIAKGDRELAANNLLAARSAYNQALLDDRTAEHDRQTLRGKLAAINQDLVFSNKVLAGDPICENYTVGGGDSLARITRKRELAVDWRLLRRVNNLGEKANLTVGQRLKLVRGPFHAVVHKDAYRLDLFWGPPAEPKEWIYIRSYTVGLGENDGTPLGNFVVKKNSKLVNPHWVNPRTGQRFGADDPANPIGEYWVGIEGVGESASATGYGLHGTIDPASVGQQKSMGCVRLLPADIEAVYELLGEQVSVVRIVP